MSMRQLTKVFSCVMDDRIFYKSYSSQDYVVAKQPVLPEDYITVCLTAVCNSFGVDDSLKFNLFLQKHVLINVDGHVTL